MQGRHSKHTPATLRVAKHAAAGRRGWFRTAFSQCKCTQNNAQSGLQVEHKGGTASTHLQLSSCKACSCRPPRLVSYRILTMQVHTERHSKWLQVEASARAGASAVSRVRVQCRECQCIATCWESPCSWVHMLRNAKATGSNDNQHSRQCNSAGPQPRRTESNAVSLSCKGLSLSCRQHRQQAAVGQRHACLLTDDR
jgi:hypothetical protein